MDLEAACAALGKDEAPPYWAFCWGAGQALARWLLDHPEQVRGRHVVDFGAGCGVAAIAAALAGAARATAVDVDPVALAAARANAAANGLHADAFGVAASLPDAWDLLVAGDVLYESAPRSVIDGLRAGAAASGAGLLVAQPERPGSTRHPNTTGHRAAVLAKYAVRTFPDVDSPTVSASVFRLA